MDKTSKCSFKYEHRARIVFSGQFPLDMLRYDRCIPLEETDCSIIGHSFNDYSGEAKVVLVRTISDKKDWASAWTFGRWQSFSCRVLEPVYGEGSEWNRMPEKAC